jgi:hypothetical protein
MGLLYGVTVTLLNLELYVISGLDKENSVIRLSCTSTYIIAESPLKILMIQVFMTYVIPVMFLVFCGSCCLYIIEEGRAASKSLH